MTVVRSFLRFLSEFVIGDDWRVAAGVVLALGITAAVATSSVPAWWVLPVAVFFLLAGTVASAARSR